MQVSDDSSAEQRLGTGRSAEASSDPFGAWTYLVDDGTLSWADSVFGLFGFAVNEVVPTLSLMSSHQHPLDQPVWDGHLQTILTTGAVASVWHRIIDADLTHRTMHTVLWTVTDSAGGVAQVDDRPDCPMEPGPVAGRGGGGVQIGAFPGRHRPGEGHHHGDHGRG